MSCTLFKSFFFFYISIYINPMSAKVACSILYASLVHKGCFCFFWTKERKKKKMQFLINVPGSCFTSRSCGDQGSCVLCSGVYIVGFSELWNCSVGLGKRSTFPPEIYYQSIKRTCVNSFFKKKIKKKYIQKKKKKLWLFYYHVFFLMELHSEGQSTAANHFILFSTT